MFWKKKDRPPGDSFAISYELDRRHFFRVSPDVRKPVWLRILDRNYQVKDISAGGAALNGAEFTTGRSLEATLVLPDGQPPLEVKARVVSRLEAKGLCTVQFADLNPSDVERLHQYVLGRQKEELERARQEAKKKRSQEPTP